MGGNILTEVSHLHHNINTSFLEHFLYLKGLNINYDISHVNTG